MTLRLLFIATVFLLAGCGGSAATSAPAPKSDAKLAPEAELDPVTATEKYQKSKKPKP